MTETRHDTILLVGNPTSHSGKAAARIDKARELMNRKGVRHEFRSTLPDGGTVDMVRKAVDDDGFGTVVYMGGDGTFYEVATGICLSHNPSAVKMGMLPSGTANDQGKSFGISSSPSALEENIDIITAGNIEYLDVGQIEALNDRQETMSTDFFFDSIGWGLSAAILAFRNRELKLVKKMPVWREMYRDQAIYVRAAMHEIGMKWLTRDRFNAELEVDGKTIQLDYLSDLTISNTLVYAGEWIVDPTAKSDDGLVEIAPFKGLRDWTSKLIIHHKKNAITQEKLEKLGLTHAPVLRGRNIDLHILRPNVDERLPAQRDGEEFIVADHYRINVLPRLLRLIVPNNFHWI